MSADHLPREHRCRIDAWRSARDFVAIGNLGEQVTGRLLAERGHQVLATQDDLMGGVSNILDRPATENPEDFIVIDPEGRLLTVNSKASVSPRTSRLTRDGNLSRPSLRGQGGVEYYSMRAGLLSPLDGAQTHGQVVKVDLVHLKAQVFEIEDDGRLTHRDTPVNVEGLVEAVMWRYPERVPPPTSDDLE